MIRKMFDAEYFAMEGVSNSFLSRFDESPAAALIPLETTPQMALGSAAHCLILEGRDEFEKRFAVSPACDRRTKEGKAMYNEFCAGNPGKQVITLDQLNDIAGMAESVAAHPCVADLLGDGQPELAFTWRDTQTGVDCKGKCDWLSNSALIDLKTTQSSMPHVFGRTIINSGYYRQMAFYLDGLKANMVTPPNTIIIAVKNTAPYTCNVFSIDDQLLECGRVKYLELLKKYKACHEVNWFPSYTYGGVIPVKTPIWMSEEAM